MSTLLETLLKKTDKPSVNLWKKELASHWIINENLFFISLLKELNKGCESVELFKLATLPPTNETAMSIKLKVGSENDLIFTFEYADSFTDNMEGLEPWFQGNEFVKIPALYKGLDKVHEFNLEIISGLNRVCLSPDTPSLHVVFEPENIAIVFNGALSCRITIEVPGHYSEEPRCVEIIQKYIEAIVTMAGLKDFLGEVIVVKRGSDPTPRS